jgi:hypothetical protein
MTAPKTPAEAEGRHEDLEFSFEDKTYSVPAPDDWDLDILEAYEEGRIVAVVKGLLGEAQYGAFKAMKRRTVGDLGRLFDALQEVMDLPS